MSYFAKNKKAYHDLEILETLEAGIVLNGDEVKSIRGNQANLKGSYIDVEKDQAFINEAHISKYKFSSNQNYNPTRKRKLILKSREIEMLGKSINEKGITAVPLELYPKGGLIKVKVGICRGKKLHDKRADLKRKAQDMEIKRSLKRF